MEKSTNITNRDGHTNRIDSFTLTADAGGIKVYCMEKSTNILFLPGCMTEVSNGLDKPCDNEWIMVLVVQILLTCNCYVNRYSFY